MQDNYYSKLEILKTGYYALEVYDLQRIIFGGYYWKLKNSMYSGKFYIFKVYLNGLTKTVSFLKKAEIKKIMNFL